ncbi:TolB family protein [Streptomyces sp. NPDC053079]|uniref:TolB family protein n=1 Tax=Streptomyces sp. NPDC053079 TaxID=3365697 RepID=UPI0037D76058
MRYLRRTAALTLMGGCAAFLPGTAAAAAGDGHRAPRTERVSVAADGAQGDRESQGAKISADGRVVVFHSSATNLVPGTTTRHEQLFAKNLRTGRADQVSVAGDGTQPDAPAEDASVSGDGRYVVFASRATNLAPGRDPGYIDVYVRDRVTGRTEGLLERGQGQKKSSYAPAISADGRYVAFVSSRTDLVPGETGNVAHVFVRDRRKGTTERVSVASDGTPLPGFSDRPVISADGGTVGFENAIPGLTPKDIAAGESAQAPRPRGFYVRDLRTGRTELGARRLDGRPAAVSGPVGLSPDGRHALFASASTGVVKDDTNRVDDLFARDLRTGVTQRLSVAADGTQANDDSSGDAVMSADNRRVYFSSRASNLVPGDTNDSADVFVRDLATGAVERVGLAGDGAQGNSESYGPGVDLAGRNLVFSSYADNLVPGDTNKTSDVFLRRLK